VATADPGYLWTRHRTPVRTDHRRGQPVLNVAVQGVVGGQLRPLRTPGLAVGMPLRGRGPVFRVAAPPVPSWPPRSSNTSKCSTTRSADVPPWATCPQSTTSPSHSRHESGMITTPKPSGEPGTGQFRATSRVEIINWLDDNCPPALAAVACRLWTLCASTRTFEALDPMEARRSPTSHCGLRVTKTGRDGWHRLHLQGVLPLARLRHRQQHKP
jgi:hypothetical protein